MENSYILNKSSKKVAKYVHCRQFCITKTNLNFELLTQLQSIYRKDIRHCNLIYILNIYIHPWYFKISSPLFYNDLKDRQRVKRVF